MSAPDIEFTIRLNFYTETQFQRYLNWYGQNAKQMKCYLSTEALLRSEYAEFNARTSDNAGPNDEAAFRAFVSGVDGIMAAQNPEVVIAVARDNDQTRNQPDTPGV